MRRYGRKRLEKQKIRNPNRDKKWLEEEYTKK